VWSRNKANLYIRDALDDFHYDPKALPSPIAQRKIYRNKLMLTHLSGFGGGGSVPSPGTSYKFNGTTDFLTVADNSGFDIGSGDFTIDCWIRLNSVTARSDLVTHGAEGDTTPLVTFSYAGTGVGVSFDGNSADDTSFVNCQQDTSVGWAVYTWHHVAIERDGSSWQCFLDGSTVGSAATQAGDMGTISGVVRIGRFAYAGGYYLNGYIDEVRWSDTARYSGSGFTPSATAYASDANTILLIHGNEAIVSGTTGSGATFTDSGNVGLTVTEQSGAIRDTTVAKF